MKFTLKELKRISQWFDDSSGDLNDFDLKIYEKINEFIKDIEYSSSKDPLIYKPPKKKRKKTKLEMYGIHEEEIDQEKYKDLVYNPYDDDD